MKANLNVQLRNEDVAPKNEPRGRGGGGAIIGSVARVTE